jgi:hypothetical protein
MQKRNKTDPKSKLNPKSRIELLSAAVVTLNRTLSTRFVLGFWTKAIVLDDFKFVLRFWTKGFLRDLINKKDV